jgi:hypothetical protein
LPARSRYLLHDATSISDDDESAIECNAGHKRSFRLGWRRCGIGSPCQVSGWNEMAAIPFEYHGASKESIMRKLLAIVIASLIAGTFTLDAASARYHHRAHHQVSHGTTTGMSTRPAGPAGSNAELQGNNGNSAGGSNSLANPDNASKSH